MKGYVYTIEVMIAISLIFLSLVSMFSTPEKPTDYSLTLIKEQGFDSLEYLDHKGSLEQFVSQQDELSLESQLVALLPPNIEFESEFCTTNCSTRNLPAQRTVVIVDYYTAVYRDQFLSQKVRLYLWERF
ncbi:MAG: hypothetical protein HY832_02510 [Candidatus Aenigmarchaeota archaeon]|nr:hypothetical protein [Candidatus Aenigmarchaeota archaeon]